MFASDSLSPPSRGLRVNDLLNPICPSDTEGGSPLHQYRRSTNASPPLTNTHTHTLPSFSNFKEHTRELRDPAQSDNRRDPSPNSTIPSFSKAYSDSWRPERRQSKGDEQAVPLPGGPQDGQAHFSLRSAQWKAVHPSAGHPRPELPPLQTVCAFKIEPRPTVPFSASPYERRYVGDAGSDSPKRSGGNAFNRPIHRSSAILTSPSSPTSPREVPQQSGFASSYMNTAPALMAIPHSPYDHVERLPVLRHELFLFNTLPFAFTFSDSEAFLSIYSAKLYALIGAGNAED